MTSQDGIYPIDRKRQADIALEFTDAAKREVDKYADLQRERLIREIVRNRRNQFRDSGRIREEDVVEAIRRVHPDLWIFDDWSEPRLLRTALVTRMRLLTAAALLAGLLTLAISVLLFASDLSFEFPRWFLIGFPAVAGIIGGSTTALAARAARRARITRQRTIGAVLNHEFIQRMNSVERIARELTARHFGKEESRANLRRILDTLVRVEIWTDEDLDAYRALLRIRNAIVHEDRLNVASGRIAQAISEAARLEDLLSSPGRETLDVQN